MLRVLAVVGLVSLVVLACYLPSQFPARTFYDHLRAEHERNSDFWGDTQADEILERALAIDEKIVKAPATLAPKVAAPLSPLGPVSPAFQRLGELRQRFLDSSYVQGMRATLLLAEYRVSAFAQWGVLACLFVGLALLDGIVVRLVRSYEFGDHSPVKFGVFGFSLLTFLWLVFVSFMWPTAIHPLFYGTAPVVLGVLLGSVVANFHRSSMKPHNNKA